MPVLVYPLDPLHTRLTDSSDHIEIKRISPLPYKYGATGAYLYRIGYEVPWHYYDVWQWDGQELVQHSSGKLFHPSYTSEYKPTGTWYKDTLVIEEHGSNLPEHNSAIVVIDTATGQTLSKNILPQGWGSFAEKGHRSIHRDYRTGEEHNRVFWSAYYIRGYRASNNGEFLIACYEQEKNRIRGLDELDLQPELKIAIIGPEPQGIKEVGPVRKKRNHGILQDYTISNDGQYTAIAGWWDNEIIVIDNATSEILWADGLTKETVRKLIFSNDGTRIYVATKNGVIIEVASTTGEILREVWQADISKYTYLPAPEDIIGEMHIYGMAISPNNNLLAVSGLRPLCEYEFCVYLIDINSGKLLDIFTHRYKYKKCYIGKPMYPMGLDYFKSEVFSGVVDVPVGGMVFSPDSQRLATIAHGSLKVWNCINQK